MTSKFLSITLRVRRYIGVLTLCIISVGAVKVIASARVNNFFRKTMCPRCSIVVVDIDILRADAVRCFGEGKNITPNICRLITESTYFSNNYSQSYWTLPSVLSTITSLYPNVINVWGMPTGFIKPTSQTLAGSLQEKGYQTYYFGKDDDATLTKSNGGLRGYTHVNVDSLSPLKWADALKKSSKMQQPFFAHFYTAWLHAPYLLDASDQPIQSLSKPPGLPVYVSEYDSVWARYIASHVDEIFSKQTIGMHPEIFLADKEVRSQRIVDFFALLEKQHDYTQRLLAWDSLEKTYSQFIRRDNSDDAAYLRMLYETKLHILDRNMSSFIDYLMQPDIASHTIVVLTSSHGEAFGEHGEFFHPSIPYNEVYHVPLAIRLPAQHGRRIAAVTENIDIFPTITQLVSGVIPENIQGVSLVPLLLGTASEAKSFAISMYRPNFYVIQDRQYALIIQKTDPIQSELFDLILDPKETRNIASSHPDIVKKYYRLLVERAAPELAGGEDQLQIFSPIDRKNLIENGYF